MNDIGINNSHAFNSILQGLHTYIYTHTHTHMHTYVHACICTHTHAYIHTYKSQWVTLTLTPSCANCLEILEASTSWSPKSVSRPVIEWLYFYIHTYKCTCIHTHNHMHSHSTFHGSKTLSKWKRMWDESWNHKTYRPHSTLKYYVDVTHSIQMQCYIYYTHLIMGLSDMFEI